MSRAVVLLCFVLLAAYAAGNLIRDDDVTTKDVKIPRDDMSSANDVVPNEEALVDVEKNEVETPAEVSETEPHVECQQIGQFCTNHADCCTHACLGYLKRCVSGSGK